MRHLVHLFLTILLSVLSACGGGSGGDSTSPTPTPVPPPAPVVGTVKGTAFAVDTAAPLANAKVSVGEVSTTTANDGTFTLNNVPAQERAVVKFEATDYAPAFSAVAVVDKQTSAAQGLLNKVGATSTFAANAASTVTVPNSPAQVALTADSIVNAATGAAPSGIITAKITPIDPASNPQSMPGDYTSLTATGAVQSIESFGAVNVELKDAAGNKLNLASGKSATIRIPVSSRTTNNPATIPLYYFNESNGRWVQEGTATLSADKQYYEGTVTHFSTWNCDRPIEETIYVNGCLVDSAGKPVANAYYVSSEGVDYSGSAYSFTDISGKFRVAMKKGGIATVGASILNINGSVQESNRVSLSPPATDADITLPNCLVLSDAAVFKLPVINAQPVDLTVGLGSAAYFYVRADCRNPMTYQWYRNGALIPGATSSYYWLNNTVIGDNAAIFTVVVTSLGGSVTSSPANLTVVVPAAPIITKQPVSQSVFAGDAVYFSVTSIGSAPLSYQWYRNGTAIADANFPFYSTKAGYPADNGAIYSVTISNAAGSITSTNATLTVKVATLAPVISSQPASITVYTGQQAYFSVVSSNPPLTYQWLRDGVAIAGATGSLYTTAATTAADNGAKFSVVVTNNVGSVTSSVATLTVSTTTLTDIEKLQSLISLPFDFFGSEGPSLFDQNDVALPAAGICQSGSYTASLDGVALQAGTKQPSGSHTISSTFNGCVNASSQTNTTGSFSRSYNIDSTLLSGSATDSKTNLREISTGTTPSDVTANGSTSVVLVGQLVSNIETKNATVTIANGATFKNNLTNNLATFTTGSIGFNTVEQVGGVKPITQKYRIDYNAVAYTIGAVNYVVNGFLQGESLTAGTPIFTGEITLKANGVQVGRQYVGANGFPTYEVTGIPQIFVPPPSPGKLLGRIAAKF
jgi:hypothetical protein